MRTPRRAAGLAVLGSLLLIALAASVAVGSKDIPLPIVLEVLLSPGGDEAYVVWSLRVPRTVVALVVGAALGAAGALIQALTRNPLADPGILGVNAGAAFFVALGVAVGGVTSIVGQMWLAVFGAFLVTLAVSVIGRAGRGGADPLHLTLVGVALGAVLTGGVTALNLMNPRAFDQMRGWSAGSLIGRGWDVLLPVIPIFLGGMLLALIAASALNAIALGSELAAALGVDERRVRMCVVLAVTLMAGGATAVAGPIGFVGLAVPHLARWITGPDQRWILALSMVLGPLLVLLADVVGRLAVWPGELPAGIVTAFVVSPALILLVRRRRVLAL